MTPKQFKKFPAFQLEQKNKLFKSSMEKFLEYPEGFKRSVLITMIKSGECSSIACNVCPILFSGPCTSELIRRRASGVFVELFGSDELFEELL